MSVSLPFEQAGVFSGQPFKSNTVAVVIGADHLSSRQILEFAAWAQSGETILLLRPTVAEADYHVRIFTPLWELPFAGHPTLGNYQVWLNQGGDSAADEVVQEYLAGLIRIRRKGTLLSFAASPLLRSGTVEDEVLRRTESGLGLSPGQVLDSQWVDNGPGWVAVRLAARDEILAIRPDYTKLDRFNVGVVAPWQGPQVGADTEVRASTGEELNEDPVTGGLNASLAQWSIGTEVMPGRYTASQDMALGRRGRISIEQIGGDIWIGGEVQPGMSGQVVF